MVDHYHGSISTEHGNGSLKAEKLERHKPQVALGLMRNIRHALDPLNLINPGPSDPGIMWVGNPRSVESAAFKRRCPNGKYPN